MDGLTFIQLLEKYERLINKQKELQDRLKIEESEIIKEAIANELINTDKELKKYHEKKLYTQEYINNIDSW